MDVTMRESSPIATWRRHLTAVGMDPVEHLSEQYTEAEFGNATALFRVGSIVLRVTRDKGQEFLEIGSTHRPGKFFTFDDVCIAFGWRGVAHVVNRKEPVPFPEEASALVRSREELAHAFAEQRIEETEARIERATRQRQREFMQRMRGARSDPT